MLPAASGCTTEVVSDAPSVSVMNFVMMCFMKSLLMSCSGGMENPRSEQYLVSAAVCGSHSTGVGVDVVESGGSGRVTFALCAARMASKAFSHSGPGWWRRAHHQAVSRVSSWPCSAPKMTRRRAS